MSDTDDTKEIPARQVPDQQRAPWRIVPDDDGSGDFLVLDADGQIVVIGVPIQGDNPNGADTRARALCIAKAPEMQRLLSLVVDTDRESFNVFTWVREVAALLERAE